MQGFNCDFDNLILPWKRNVIHFSISCSELLTNGKSDCIFPDKIPLNHFNCSRTIPITNGHTLFGLAGDLAFCEWAVAKNGPIMMHRKWEVHFNFTTIAVDYLNNEIAHFYKR